MGRGRGVPGRWALTAPCALAALLAAGACGQSARTADVAPPDSTGTAPEVALPNDSVLIEGAAASDPLPPLRLADLSGELQSLLAPEDDVTVVNFWASWCSPCLAEIPQLVAFQAAWRTKRVRVVGVAVASGSPDEIRRFANEHHMDYDLLVMDEAAARRYFSQLHLPAGLPLSLVVDRRGMIRRKFFGPHTAPQFSAATKEAL